MFPGLIPGLALLLTLRGQCDPCKGWNCPLSPLQMKQVKSQTDVCGPQTEALTENRGCLERRDGLWGWNTANLTATDMDRSPASPSTHSPSWEGRH